MHGVFLRSILLCIFWSSHLSHTCVGASYVSGNNVLRKKEIELVKQLDELLFNPHFRSKQKKKSVGKCEQVAQGQCDVGLRFNGCGPKAWQKIDSNIFYRQDMEMACNKHDICYNCGMQKGWTQKDCDKAFYKDVKSLCKCRFSNSIKLLPCYASAGAMYAMVRAAGHNFYLDHSHNYCDNHPCVDNFSPQAELLYKEK